MKLKLLFAFALIFTVSIFSVTAQSAKKQKALTVINYGESVKAPLTAKELSFIKEAYGENAEAYVLNNAQRVKDIKHILRNRVYIEEHKTKDLSPFKLLSTIANANENENTGSIFNPNTFNVLKYNFNFYSRSTETITYRVDNTSYLINVKPQHQ